MTSWSEVAWTSVAETVAAVSSCGIAGVREEFAASAASTMALMVPSKVPFMTGLPVRVRGVLAAVWTPGATLSSV